MPFVVRNRAIDAALAIVCESVGKGMQVESLASSPRSRRRNVRADPRQTGNEERDVGRVVFF